MKIAQIRWRAETGWTGPANGDLAAAQLVLVFGDHPRFSSPELYEELRHRYPDAHIVGSSTAGNIVGTKITDDEIVATAVQFSSTSVRVAKAPLTGEGDLEQCRALLAELSAGEQPLRHVFVLAEGLLASGSEIAEALRAPGDAGFRVTGGLAGDGYRAVKTHVLADGPASERQIAAVGFYGGAVIRCGCRAGWEDFGPERVITRSSGKVVFEIDGQPALPLYEKYLGALAEGLPATGLRFPLSIRKHKDDDRPIIRSVQVVDRANGSLAFAGDVPQGYLGRLMKTNVDKLIDAAGEAARDSTGGDADGDALCIAVSCVGRRLVLSQLAEEELEAVQSESGARTVLAGFYAYGEIAPQGELLTCQLHNQTMTLTRIHEVAG